MNRILMFSIVFQATAAFAADPCAHPHAGNAAQCVNREYERLDKQVSAKYEQVLRKLSAPEVRRHLDDADEAKSLLIATQRSWKNYRHQQCRTVTAVVRSSVPEGQARSSCLSKITRARLAELRELEP